VFSSRRATAAEVRLQTIRSAEAEVPLEIRSSGRASLLASESTSRRYSRCALPWPSDNDCFIRNLPNHHGSSTTDGNTNADNVRDRVRMRPEDLPSRDSKCYRSPTMRLWLGWVKPSRCGMNKLGQASFRVSFLESLILGWVRYERMYVSKGAGVDDA